MFNLKKFLLTAVGALALGASVSAGPVKADDYPSQLIKAVVPFSAGGGTDRANREDHRLDAHARPQNRTHHEFELRRWRHPPRREESGCHA